MTTQETLREVPTDLPATYHQTQTFIEDAKSLSLSLHQNGQAQVQIESEKAKIKLHFQEEVDNDKALTNADKRKTGLTKRLESDEAYREFELRLQTLKNESALISIELRYKRDLIDLNLAFIK
ncbi:MAG: hypothetical protein AAGA83_25480 [Cyanobacteria bacterium P01_F01_bin.116]